MGDVKTLLKEARKLIDEKNFKEAQECCKNILRKDKQNYLALVLLGKSLQDTDQAPLAYQKAISCKYDNPLAWHGLASYYEKQDDTQSKKKLLEIYENMLKLQLEDEKISELLTKIGQIGITLRSDQAITVLSNYTINTSADSKLKEVAQNQLLAVVQAGVNCKAEDIHSALSIFNEIYLKQPNESLELTIAKVTLQKSDFLSAIEDVIKAPYFAENNTIHELLCKLLCEKFMESYSFGAFDIEANINIVTKGIENTNQACLLKSMFFYHNSQFVDAYKLIIPSINSQPDTTTVLFIIQCTMKLKKWSVAQKLAESFLSKFRNPASIAELRKFLFLSLTKQNKWSQAAIVSKEIPKDSLSMLEQANLAECCIHLRQDSDEIMTRLQDTEYYVPLQSLKLLKEKKYTEAIQLINNSNQNEDPTSLLHLGKAYWELKEFDKCQLNLLKSAKMNPENSESFLYLGHFYRHHVRDFERAKKCYEKAYNLNENDSNIIKNLSEIYSSLNESDKDFCLLSKAASNVDLNDSWINFRLGMHCLNKREWESAIMQFRNVIKKDHTSAVAFECLADAYFSRGSYTSALRAYARVMTLDDRRTTHCQTRMGYIYSILTQYNDSISTFEKVLGNDPDSVLALKGISETWMRVAKKKYDAKLYGSARDSAQQAVNYVMSALSKNKQYNCLWKILGDSLTFITKLPETYAYVIMVSLLKDGGDAAKVVKLDIFPQAIACFARIAKAKKQPSTYDLASIYFNFYCESNKVTHLNIAFNLTTTCIKEKPSLWRNWNLLGRITMNIKKYNISQHCFIKALQATRKWSVAKIWCNLGMLYVKLKLHKLANYCFWRGQSTLPSYPHSWIGQGLIAEAIREEEAMDLFRHASRLGYHRESALGYADWVCRTLRSNINNKNNTEFKYVIEGLHATSYAIDLIEWFACFEPEEACALNMLGILQERCGLLQAALKSYEKALLFSEETKKNVIFLNLARVHLRLQQYDEAVKFYKSITEASLDSACGLALALYKNGLYEESYSTYDTALQWLCSDDLEKADVLVAMAGIVYMFKGMDDAKTLLFHSIQVVQKKPTADSLYAICSLGLLHSDQSLSKLALSELKKYEKESSCGFDIGFLKSYIQICEGSLQKAVKFLSESLHDHPNNALLWFCMAQYCLQMSETKARIASCCAQKALSSDFKEGGWNPGQILATASIAEHIAGDKNKAFNLAKKGLHIYPHQAEVWAALLLSLLTNKAFVTMKSWSLSAASHMRKDLTISRPLARWASLLEKKINSF